MIENANRLALLATGAGAFLVLLLFAPALEAPFLVPKLAALEIAAALGALAFALRRQAASSARWDRLLVAFAWAVLATSAIAWLGALRGPVGAPYALEALARWGCLFGIACGASVVSSVEGGVRHVLTAVAIAAATLSSVGLVQHALGVSLGIPVFSLPGSTFGNRNLAAEAIAMCLPLGAPLALREPRREARVAVGVALGLELAFLAVTRARGAWVGAGLGVGTVLWLERRNLSRRTLAAIAGGVVVAALLAALPGRWTPHDAGDVKRYGGVLAVLEGSVDPRAPALRTRLGFWKRTLTMVGDRPWLGVGPGNWPVVFPAYAEPNAARDGVLRATLAPRQAHDDFLERTAETGVLGAFALLGFAVAIVRAVRRRLRADDPDARVLAVGVAGAFVALTLISVAGFPLDMPGTIALTGLALGFVAVDDTSRVTRGRGLALPAVVAAGLLVPWALVRAERSVRRSLLYAVGERALHRDRGPKGAIEARTALEACLAIGSAFGPELREAQMWLRDGHAGEAIAASERALAIEPYSPNAWATVASARLAANDATGAVRAASEALSYLQDYPFALDVRAKAERALLDEASARQDRERLRALAHADDEDTRRAAQDLLSANGD